MTSLFSILEDAVSLKCDEVFGETFTFMPMTQDTVNSPSSPDAERPMREIIGIFAEPTRILPELGAKTVTQGFGSGHAENVTVTTPRIGVDRIHFADGILPLTKDRFKRHKTGVVYSVEDVQPDGEGRAVLYVMVVNREAPIP